MVTPFPKRKNRPPSFVSGKRVRKHCYVLPGIPIGTSHPQLDGKNKNGWEGLGCFVRACNHIHGPRICNIDQYVYTHLKFNIAPWKVTFPKGKVVFQPSFFGGYVNFRRIELHSLQLSSEDVPWHFRQQCGHAEVPCDAPSCRCNIFSVACQASQTLGDMDRVHLSQTLLHTSIIINRFWLNHKGWMYYMQHVLNTSIIDYILSSIQEMTYECVCTPSRLPLFPLKPTSLEDQSKLRTATATPFLKRRVGDRPLWARGAPRVTKNAA